MQSFPLRRLPLLAINEVIKSMDILEIFVFSLVSKKSQNLVMLSIPKHTLKADFAFKNDGLLFALLPVDISAGGLMLPLKERFSIQGKFSLMRICSNCYYAQCDFSSFSGTSEVEDSIRELFHSLSKTFNISEFYLKFEDGTREEFAMEIINFVWENDFSLEQIDFYLENVSSESIEELLDGCHENDTSLEIESKIPEGFKCTPPPGGYEFGYLAADYAHWVNLDDFLQCQRVVFQAGFPDLTVEYLNDLLKKIVNMECGLESFKFELKSLKLSDFAAIVDGLSENAIMETEEWQQLQFERKDGRKLLLNLCDDGDLDLQDDYLQDL